MSEKVYKRNRYWAIALDPIHIGTGGYRIGRVDNTIVREPATDIPKIPGTTIEGTCRSYAYLKARDDGGLNEENYADGTHPLACAKGKKTKVGEDDKLPCGKCEICVTFGYTSDSKSLQAMALFSDARILLFPVATMIGPVWVTCPMVLRDAGINNHPTPSENKFITSLSPPENYLNFGWLLLEKDEKDNSSKSIETSLWGLPNELQTVLQRVVIVPDELLSTIVNSNLEVRTSVAIDPERGAAEERALFTYEAIPRGTVFWFDVIYQNPLHFPVLNNLSMCLENIVSTAENGLRLFKFLGVGGMGSRGFGRIEILNL